MQTCETLLNIQNTAQHSSVEYHKNRPEQFTMERHKLDLRKVLENKVNNLLQSQATPIYSEAPQIRAKEYWTARDYKREFNGLVTRPTFRNSIRP